MSVARRKRREVQLLEVEWSDATHHGGWKWKPDIRKGASRALNCCWTVGYIANKTSRILFLAQSENKDEFGDIMAIPRSAIIRTRRLR